MCVRVEKAGGDGPTIEIDPFGVRAGESLNVAGSAHGNDAPVPDRHGLEHLVGRIDGNHRPVHENQVGGLTG